MNIFAIMLIAPTPNDFYFIVTCASYNTRMKWNLILDKYFLWILKYCYSSEEIKINYFQSCISIAEEFEHESKLIHLNKRQTYIYWNRWVQCYEQRKNAEVHSFYRFIRMISCDVEIDIEYSWLESIYFKKWMFKSRHI